MSAATATRRPKWHPTPVPPPPSPKILNLPRRIRRKPLQTTTTKPAILLSHRHQNHYRGKLQLLFDQQRAFYRNVPVVLLSLSERRGIVQEDEENTGGIMDERWRFQAEILRAECNFLRIDRELALKKLERNRVQMESTLKSVVHTLVSGRKKIYEGKNVNAVLEEEIKDLAEKLEELRKSSKTRGLKLRKCDNFDQRTNVLQRRLEKLGGLSDEKCVKGIRELAASSLSSNNSHELENKSFDSGLKTNNKFNDVKLLRRKMEELSKGMLDRMEEEYGSMHSPTATSSVASSASTTKRIEFPLSCSLSTGQPHQESVSHEENKCSGRCKAVVRRIMEQVRAETEQWSQMQEMLGQLRQEMEELQASRDCWEDRALESDHEIQSLSSAVQEWKQKALILETKTTELQTEISALKGELEKLKSEQKEATAAKESPPISLGKQLQKEMRVLVRRLKEHQETNDMGSKHKEVSKLLRIEQKVEVTAANDLPGIAVGEQLEKQKHLPICSWKENHRTNNKWSVQDTVSSNGKVQRTHTDTGSSGLGPLKRSPLTDIGNSSPLMRQKSKVVFPMQSAKLFKTGSL